MNRVVLFVVLALGACLAASPAAAGPRGLTATEGIVARIVAKAGGAYAAPAAPSFSRLVGLRRYRTSLVEVRRGRVAHARRLLRAAGAREIAPSLRVWQVSSETLLRRYPEWEHAGIVDSVAADRPLERSARSAVRAEPLFAQQWALAAVGATSVTPPGPGRPLAIIDSGVDMAHPEFAGRPNTAVLNAQRTVGEGEYHGTAVASTAAAPANNVGMVGVYPQAVLQIWDASPRGPGMTVGDEITGIAEAIKRRAGVVNLSLGSDEYSELEEKAVLAAFGSGVLVVASAGNEFEDGNPDEYPASLRHVLTVASTNSQNSSSSFSNQSLAVDMAAPGEGIVAAVPTWHRSSGYRLIDGTSFASPIVAAAAAWVWTARPTLDVTQLFDLMRFSARDIWKPGFDTDTGYGLLDIPKALTAAPPSSDGREPNDDVFHVKAGGLFAQAARAMTDKTRSSASFAARLDITEDPEDVYRVWVPGKRKVTIQVAPTDNVDIEAWRPNTPSVLVKDPQRKQYLIAGSYGAGKTVERLVISNSGRAGSFIYLDVFLPKNGPGSASYSASIRTTR